MSLWKLLRNTSVPSHCNALLGVTAVPSFDDQKASGVSRQRRDLRVVPSSRPRGHEKMCAQASFSGFAKLSSLNPRREKTELTVFFPAPANPTMPIKSTMMFVFKLFESKKCGQCV